MVTEKKTQMKAVGNLPKIFCGRVHIQDSNMSIWCPFIQTLYCANSITSIWGGGKILSVLLPNFLSHSSIFFSLYLLKCLLIKPSETNISALFSFLTYSLSWQQWLSCKSSITVSFFSFKWALIISYSYNLPSEGFFKTLTVLKCVFIPLVDSNCFSKISSKSLRCFWILWSNDCSTQTK